MLRVIQARYAGDYRFEIELSDGHRGVVDLSDILGGEVFASLRDRALFAQGRVDLDAGVLSWPNGADLAPEYLLYRIAADEPSLREMFRRWGYLQASPTDP